MRALESRAAIVDVELEDDDLVWQAGDLVPTGPIVVTGRLSAAGPGRFYWHGRIEGDVVLPCRRCLNDTRAHVADEAHVIFAETGDVETDDPDVYRLDPRAREVDLEPVIREQWLLNVPSYSLCREDCNGLCPTCGAELNVARCQCPAAIHSVWDALRKVDTTSD